MSLIKGDDFRTVFVEAEKVNANVLVASQVYAVSGVTPITGTLNLASFSGAQPQNFGSIVGIFNALDVKGASGYPGQIVSFMSEVSTAVTEFSISHLSPQESIGVKLGTISGARGVRSVAGQLLCLGPSDWRLLGAAAISVA